MAGQKLFAKFIIIHIKSQHQYFKKNHHVIIPRIILFSETSYRHFRSQDKSSPQDPHPDDQRRSGAQDRARGPQSISLGGKKTQIMVTVSLYHLADSSRLHSRFNESL